MRTYIEGIIESFSVTLLGPDVLTSYSTQYDHWG